MNAQPAPESVVLSITGMSCAGCVRSVETALSAVPDVESATVNFADQTAVVKGHAGTGVLIAAVEKAGYSAQLLTDTSLAKQEEEIVQQFRIALFRSLIALSAGALLMADMWFGLLPPLDQTLVWLVIGVATLAIMLVAGGHFYRGAANATLHMTATMDTLIALGTGTAWLFSMIVVLAPDLVPEASRHQYFEAALFIVGFINLGKALENSARSRTSLAIQKLFDLTPKMVRLVSEGSETLVPVETVIEGQHLILLAGETVPVDGIIIEGEAGVDESMLTGESLPVHKKAGDLVRAGTMNTDGRLLLEATGVGAATLLAQMVRLVREAQNSKPKIGYLVDRITSVFVPAVVLTAILVAVIWYVAGPEPRLSFAVVSAMSVLIIACPCALGLAIPMSIMVGLGRAAASGVLVRNGEVLQVASRLDTLVMDKTGTLTVGQPAVVDMTDLAAADLAVAAALAGSSDHPLSRGVARKCAELQIEPVALSSVQTVAGAGVTAEYDGQRVVMGSFQLLQDNHVVTSGEVQAQGSRVYLAIDGQMKGCFILKDQPREGVEGVLENLRARGLKLIMLTGDNEAAAREVGQALGLDEIHAGLSPEDKLDIIRRLQEQGKVVGMVGDGINDAAALSIADIGFAMGEGTDVAMESADVTLLTESIAGVDQSIDLSRKILRNIYQNLTAAFAYNVLLIPVAAGALYPFLGVMINPALAGLAMALSSITVVLNAGRLRFQ